MRERREKEVQKSGAKKQVSEKEKGKKKLGERMQRKKKE